MKKIILPATIIAVLFIFTGCLKSVKSSDIAKETKADSTEVKSDKIVPGTGSNENGTKDIQEYSGLFTFTMSGYKGELFIENKNEKYYGTIKFFNWGNGVPQPLTDLKVSDNKIYFKRVIKTREDLLKYGGTAYFEQDFYGLFTPDRKTIKGYYRYIGTQDNWQAVKK